MMATLMKPDEIRDTLQGSPQSYSSPVNGLPDTKKANEVIEHLTELDVCYCI